MMRQQGCDSSKESRWQRCLAFRSRQFRELLDQDQQEEVLKEVRRWLDTDEDTTFERVCMHLFRQSTATSLPARLRREAFDVLQRLLFKLEEQCKAPKDTRQGGTRHVAESNTFSDASQAQANHGETPGDQPPTALLQQPSTQPQTNSSSNLHLPTMGYNIASRESHQKSSAHTANSASLMQPSPHDAGQKKAPPRALPTPRQESFDRDSPVEQLDIRTGSVLKEYCSAEAAAKALHLKVAKVLRCAQGKQQSSGNYFWRFKGSDRLPQSSFAAKELQKKKSRPSSKEKQMGRYKTKPVHKIDPNTGEVLETFASQSEAARALGGKATANISLVIGKRGRTAYGFAWRYADSEP